VKSSEILPSGPCAATAKEEHYTLQYPEIVPSASVGKCIDFNGMI